MRNKILNKSKIANNIESLSEAQGLNKYQWRNYFDRGKFHKNKMAIIGLLFFGAFFSTCLFTFPSMKVFIIDKSIKILSYSGTLKFDLDNFSVLFFCALIAFLIELFSVGYKNSSIYRLLNLKNKSERIDTYMWAVFLLNLYHLLAFIFTFGLCYKLFQMAKSAYHLHLILDVPNQYLQFSVILLLTDLQHYLTHRFFHNSSFFWEFHKYHHSATRLNVITLHRQHPFTEYFHNLFSLPIVILLGAPIENFFIIIFLRELQGYLLHSELNWNWGFIGRYILMSPAAHRLHHSKNHEHFGKNFGQGFVIWDILFRTYADPTTKHVDSIGLDDDEINDKNYLNGMIHCCKQAFKSLNVKKNPSGARS